MWAKAAKKPSVLFLIAILCYSSVFLLKGLSQPWIGFNQASVARNCIVARNYLRYGLLELKLGQAVNAEQVADLSKLTFYQHYPPLLPLLVAASFATFGESEASARAVPIVLTLGSIVLVFVISRRLFGEATAILATFFFATFPALLFFGKDVDFVPVTLFFLLLSLWLYINVVENQRLLSIGGLYIALGASLLTSWSSYFVAMMFSYHYWSLGNELRFRKSIIVGLPVYAVIIFAIFQWTSYLVDQNSFTDFVHQLEAYLGFIDPGSTVATVYTEAQTTFTLPQYVRRIMRHIDLLFYYPIVILSMVGLYVYRNEKTLGRSIIGLFLVAMVAHSAILYRSVYMHNYLLYYFAAPLAILAAIGARNIFMTSGDGAEKQTLSRAISLSSVALFFLVALVIAGGVPRFKELSEIQRKLLPEREYESASFLKAVAEKMKLASRPNEVIVTNLNPNMSAALGFYSERRIVFSMDFGSSLESLVRDNIDSANVYFLLWSPGNKDNETLYKEAEALHEWTKSNGENSQFTIDERRFIWSVVGVKVKSGV